MLLYDCGVCLLHVLFDCFVCLKSSWVWHVFGVVIIVEEDREFLFSLLRRLFCESVERMLCVLGFVYELRCVEVQVFFDG